MKILLLGKSHLALCYGVYWAKLQHKVYFLNQDKSSPITVNGKLLIKTGEPSLSKEFWINKNNIAEINVVPKKHNFDVIVIAIDTKFSQQVSDYTQIIEAIHSVEKFNVNDYPILLLSQVYPGFSRSIKTKSALFYMVETLVFGQAIKRLHKPEQIIIGYRTKSELKNFPKKLFEHYSFPLTFLPYESAELSKIAINIYLGNSIVTANILATVCEIYGADWTNVMSVLKNDKRIGKKAYLHPNLGFQGENLPRDFYSLKKLLNRKELKKEFELLEKIIEYNENLDNWILDLVDEIPLNEPIGLVGMAYKIGTTNSNNSIATLLTRKRPNRHFVIYDKVKNTIPFRSKVVYVHTYLELINSSRYIIISKPDLVVINKILTSNSALRIKMIIDPFGVVREKQVHSDLKLFQRGFSK